ncbi:MAG: nitrate reductase [Rhodospirillales bacterium]|nr:nitrate reductase [Rhodospirillales bacterium]
MSLADCTSAMTPCFPEQNSHGEAIITTHEKLSFCRICMGHCGVVLTVDDDDQLVDIRADRDDGQTLGFACFKGLQAVELHNGPARLLHPLKRQPDGSFVRIKLETALDEIAAKIKEIIAEDGADAIAGYRGGGAFFNASACTLLQDFLRAVGSPKVFSSVTIDQSAKMVAPGRLGMWLPGAHPFHSSNVTMVIGGNPLVSITNLDLRNPMKRLKEAKARGFKLIVIDPRLTETAKFADIFLQPLPGEDCAILAGMIRIILERGWEDAEFCAQNAADLDLLRAAVQPFTPAYVAGRADIPVEKLFEATEAFAHAKRGPAVSATGPNMSPHGNLAEHLIGCLNIVCGRYVREGERIENPGVLYPRYPRPAQVVPAARPWENGPKSRIGGFGTLGGEMMTGVMAAEILEPGPGRVRAMIVHGGNPVSSVPDQRKVVEAFRALDLLVSIEPNMTPTAKLSHYILPPTLMYERSDLPLWLWEMLLYPIPFTRYTEAVAVPPPGAEVSDDIYVFWSLARRMGLQMTVSGVPIDMETPPTVEDSLKIAARHAPAPWDEIKGHPRGAVFEGEPQYAVPPDPATAGKFTLAAPDVVQEIAQLFAEQYSPGSVPSNGMVFTHRLASRRHRDRFNSLGKALSGVRKRVPYNVAYLNPGDMAEKAVATGDWVELISDSGAVRAIAEGDETLRPGVVSLIHGFGDLPDSSDYLTDGVSTNLLISTDRDLQTINAMPRMSGIPVNIRRASEPLNQ